MSHLRTRLMRASVAILGVLGLTFALAGPASADGLHSESFRKQLLLRSLGYGYDSIALQAGLTGSEPTKTQQPAEQALRPVVGGEPVTLEEPQPRVLGSVEGVGDVAAAIERFRDGGHAYYLFGRGLHSCTYVGKCMDLFAAIGEPVYAVADGVAQVPPYAPSSYGNHVTTKHADGSKTISAHMSKVTIKSGPVKAGQQIGTVGCSGTSGEFNKCSSSASHLHLEWSRLKWNPGEYGELPPYFNQWRGEPMRCYKGCGP
jgi:murein DD-endopeptidase MepM/ murein hydrolase activator NlpD